MAERELCPGEVLFHIGEESDDVYIVLDGDFDVIAPTTTGEVVVGALGPDDVVGEITAVIGGRRTATVTARTDARVSVLNGGAFEDWLAQNPDRAERLAVEARTRIDRTRVTRVVAELVGTENPEIIEALTDAVEWVTISAGSALFRQGDPSDAAYILVGGQMRVVPTSQGETVLDTRIGRGDLIGEMGVIEQAPRSASAIALRDCTLARIPRVAFERLTSQYPALMLPLVRTVIARVGDRSRHKPHAGTIAVVITAPRAPSNLATELATEIDRFGDAVHLDARKVETFLNRRGIAQATRGSAAEVRLNEFLHEVDVAHRWVVLECDDPTSDWGRRAIRTADRIVVVASARPSAEERAAIDRVRTVVDSMGEHDLWAVQLNPPGTTRAVGAVQLRERTGADRVLHLREDDSASVRRLARLVSGNGTAIAFSGGGARSYGQIGALRAMHELGIEIDAVAGTSMGAVIGAFVAAVDDVALALDTAPKEFDGAKFLDYTLPITSIFRAKVVTDAVQRVFSPMQIEDTLIPFLCLSTNLSKAELVEHRRGDLAHAIRASLSLPGVFPPVPMGDDLLVDGGVLENLPARPLRADPGISTVIAVDVAPPAGPRARSDFGLSLSGFEVLRRRARREDFRAPPLAHTVISSMLVGSAQARIRAFDNDDIDLYVSLDLSGVKLLDFDRFHDAVERGYDDALPVLREWCESRTQ